MSVCQRVGMFPQRLRKLRRIESIWSTNGALVRILIALIALVPTTTAHPQDMEKTFVEFKDEKETTTYDLRTVDFVQPGKFVIVQTVLDNPDVMRFELKVLDALRSYCARPVGSYPAPAEVFTLGPPDMPVKEIEVKLLAPTAGTNYRFKSASWSLPYFKTMVGTGAGYDSYRCNQPYHTETEEYLEVRNAILNGIKIKVLFDCDRGLEGEFFDEDEKDYRRARVHPVQKGTVGARYYNEVCKAVTRKDPYLSE